MTLRCTFEIVPFGDEENKREIFRLDISNTGTVRDEGFGHEICSYKVNVFARKHGRFLKEGENPWEHYDTVFVPEHDRRDGAMVLAARAIKILEKDMEI